MDGLLPPGFTTENAFLIVAAVTAGIAVLLIWNALVVRDPLANRAKSLTQRRATLRENLLVPRRRDRAKAGMKGSFSHRVAARLGLTEAVNDGNIRKTLARAGFRSRDAVVVFLFMRAALPVGFGIAALLGVLLYFSFDPPLLYAVGIALAGAIFGFLAPGLYISNITQKRREKLRRQLPDALDLLVVCAEAGLGLDAAISRVCGEIVQSAPEIAEELSLTAIELNFMPNRRDAFHNFSERTNLEESRAIVSTLVQAERYGTPLAKALRVLSAEFRTQRLLRAEEKAARLPATLTIPMVLFILPCLFIVLIGPGILRIVDSLSNLQ